MLGTEIGQEVFGGPTPGHSREEVVGDVGDGKAIEDQLPAVTQLTELQG